MKTTTQINSYGGIAMLPQPQTQRGSQWSFLRFLVGCFCSYTNYVGGWYFLLNMFLCVVASILAGFFAYVIGIRDRLLMVGIVLLSVTIVLLCLWGVLRLIVERMPFPKCESGCCHGMNRYSYRFGTWMGMVGWRKWMFFCSCGHLYEVRHGKWRHIDGLGIQGEAGGYEESMP